MAHAIDQTWTHQIAQRLARDPLPGRAAQMRFMPQSAQNRHFSTVPEDAVPAAVAIVLCGPDGGAACDSWCLPLIRRPITMKHHAGQVCLPGGRVDGTETIREAAARELAEETGLGAHRLEHLGDLTPLYVFTSGFMVTPVVFACDQSDIEFTPNDAEVAELLRVPLSRLQDPLNQQFQCREFDGRNYQVPFFQFESHQIWGATSMILSELLAVIDDV